MYAEQFADLRFFNYPQLRHQKNKIAVQNEWDRYRINKSFL